MSEAPPEPGAAPRRTIARRLLVSYLVVLAAFAITMGWSLRNMRAASREAELLRDGYVPLQLQLGVALAEQNVLAAQFNHLLGAGALSKGNTDVREWIETLTRARPNLVAQTRDAAKQLPDEAAAFRDEAARELDAIEDEMTDNAEQFANLLRLLANEDRAQSEKVHGELVKREADVTQRIRGLKSKVQERMESLRDTAKSRETRSFALFIGLSGFTMLVGVGIALYTQRILRPLAMVTERAKAVAKGDLSPREVVRDRSEIGELAATFENMVRAIKAAREDLVHAERLATIGKMAAHITHEIRNPLSSIGLNLEMLEGEIAESGSADLAEGRELLAAIKKETARLARISEQYLSVARRPSPTLEVESVGDLVREVIAFVRPEMEAHAVKIHLDEVGDVPSIPFDEAQLRQALLNLLRNAREALSEQAKQGDASIEVRLEAAVGGGVDLRVEDGGPGIPEEVRASVFDPFFTTKQRGTGLGLAVTREIIEAHGGVIVCEARAPRGTCFRIHLPGGERST
ncbi:MAG: ATP-binding protein [Polyangiaceae bacterium]